MIDQPITLELEESFYVEQHSRDLVAGWILTILLKLGGHKEFIDDRRMNSDDLIEFFGLSKYEEEYTKEDKSAIMSALENLKRDLDRQLPHSSSPVLENNINKLCKIVELSDIEKDVLRFCIHLHYYDILENAGRLIGDLTTDKFEYVLSVLLDYPKSSIREVFSGQSALVKNSLVAIDRGSSRNLRNKIDIASNGFADKMMSSDDEIEEMIRDIVKKCTATDLKLDNYQYLSKQIDIIVPYLRNALECGNTGTNILLYGHPGTGKTELVKAIAEALSVPLYEVSYEDSDMDPIEGVRRLKAFRTAQSLFSKKKILLMFDEIEDIVNTESFFFVRNRQSQKNKGWLTRMLENNPIPTIWVTNSIRAMDNAIVRRFDMVMEMPIPPKSKRKEIIDKEIGGHIDSEVLELMASNEHIAPAIITRAAKVVEQLSHPEPSKALEMLIENTIKAQGYRGFQKNIHLLPKSYDPSYVNVDYDLVALYDGISHHMNARLCLYGAPGTGKSAFGQWIARELDRPCIVKKGSDLISKWVGGTEQNIARAFHEAKEENAVLIFDEVDSFLQDREKAKNSWEVTQVNEMLVQMENYDGIFVATTNLMEGLDHASLRRFDLKLEFKYLRPSQSWELFLNEAANMGLDQIPSAIQREVKSLGSLAPGDFAAVRRQGRFSPIGSVDDLYQRLKKEVAIKNQNGTKTMGFLR